MSRISLVAGVVALAAVACDQSYDSSPSNPVPSSGSPSAGPSGSGGDGEGGGTTSGGGDGGATTTTTTTTTSSSDGGAGPATTTGSTVGVTVGVGGAGACDGGEATVSGGAENRILFRASIVTPTGVVNGELLVDGDEIVCIAPSCASDPAANNATIVTTDSWIFPGLIDTHNHILFDIFDEDDWVPNQTYMNHNQWPNEERYGAVVDAKQYLNGEFNSPLDLGCELLKYGEVKALVSGTTGVQGSPGTAKTCFASVVRSIDTQNDLGFDEMQTATIFPSTSAADGVCANFADGDTSAYLIHVGEGVDETSRAEFDKLETISTQDGCLIAPETTIIHGTAFTPAEFTIMANNDMGLSWSPKSNVFLYGGGIDPSMTTDIPTALDMGITVALSPDWSLGGSVNMLDELRFADAVDSQVFGDILTPKDLFEMATINAARISHLDDYIGSLEVGKKADLFVVRKITNDPYTSLLAALPRDVVLTFVGGQALYGDAELQVLGPSGNTCETIELCCASKFLCIAENGGNPAQKFDQTFADIRGILTDALEDYDAQDLSQWNFAPLAPIAKCPE